MPVSPNPWALTQRQLKILARLSAGESMVRIGIALGMTGVAIRTELNRINVRLGVTTTAAALQTYRQAHAGTETG